MAIVIAIVIALLPLLGLWFLAEDKRKARGDGRVGQGSDLMRAGLMEMQSLLEPDRKVEVLRDEERKRDLLVDLDEHGDGEG